MARYDFGGYATRNDIKCSDGRTIRRNAFSHQDGVEIPIVYQHQRNDMSNIIGKALMENRDDGIYVYGNFNDTEKGKLAKQLVQHGDLKSLSIYATQLIQNGSDVTHGSIKEVSLVVAGANPGAFIENVDIEHSDGFREIIDEEATIYSGLDFEVGVEHADGDNKESKPENQNGGDDTVNPKEVESIVASMTDKQRAVFYAMIASALSEGDEEGEDDDEEAEQSEEGGNDMSHNVFEGQDKGSDKNVLTHEETVAIFEDAKKCGSLRTAVLEHGIENLEILFPEAKSLTTTPEMIMRDQEWVSKLWGGFRKTPFSRIKTVNADITKEEARARGYIKGKKKIEEQFAVFKRATTPQTVYKLQKMHRDDIIDITDFDVVSWLKQEMRIMLNEELARAALIGDGREVGAEDKISADHIRPIVDDDELYAHHVTIEFDENGDNTDWANSIIDGAALARIDYKGSGSPTAYFDSYTLAKMLLARDKIGRRLYNNVGDLATALRVKEIVEVPVMENFIRVDADGGKHKVLAIIVNPSDYSIGADKGGAVTMFDDFDIDYNRYTYLIETRCSGALIKVHSAIVLEIDYTESAPITPPPSTPPEEDKDDLDTQAYG